MNEELAEIKRRLRNEAKGRRASLSQTERVERSAQATANFTSSTLWKEASRVGVFHSMDAEIDTRALLSEAWAAGKRVALPITPPLGRALDFRWVTPESTLRRSAFGVDEPGPEAENAGVAQFDLLVVPGLAFDSRRARLGYGGGYYDRTLGDCAHSVMFAFACQQIDRVPEGPNDKRVDAVLTEDGWV